MWPLSYTDFTTTGRETISRRNVHIRRGYFYPIQPVEYVQPVGDPAVVSVEARIGHSHTRILYHDRVLYRRPSRLIGKDSIEEHIPIGIQLVEWNQ